MGTPEIEMRDNLILLVEDDPDHVALARRALERHSVAHEVVVARDGAEAIDYLLGPRPADASGPARIPRVVLLDLKLPRVDGLEVLRRLRADARTRTLPIVVLSSSDEEQDIQTSYLLGANSYVRKPIDFVQFREATRRLGEYWLTINQSQPRLGANR